jgi:flagellar protein FliJ
VETPSFTFPLERVRTLRERAEERAREALSNELRARDERADALRAAEDAVDSARSATRDAVAGGRMTSAETLRSLQGFIERREQLRSEASLDLDRQDAEVAARREILVVAARDRQAIDRLKERRKAEHDAEWAVRVQNNLDELALAVHRRGRPVAA